MVASLIRLRFCYNRPRSVKVDLGWCEAVDALMIANEILLLDEGADL
jgi:hypothetical protein